MSARTLIALLFVLALHALHPVTAHAQRLPSGVTPSHYDLAFTIDVDKGTFSGREAIKVAIAAPTRRIVLNALELTVRDVRIASASTVQTATVQTDAPREQITVLVREPIPAGDATIRLTFAGVLNPSLRGLYLSTVGAKRYAVTQFEATDARRAFPCFDEPAYKATFSLRVTAPKDRLVISNGKQVSDRPAPGNQHTVTFATTPKMSTYLIAMAVGDFVCSSGAAEGIPIRVCATPQNKAYTQLPLDYAKNILAFYNRYFGIKYPFGKLDIVAVPDFAAGAMENTGAIFYREEYLLVDPAKASSTTRRLVASVLAHEMAHQWFGDLVTMAWWDDLWLNEGFATWMANLPLMAMHEDWQIEVAEVEETQGALTVDALRATRPIHMKVEAPAEIEAAFDPIAYEKGASVLRMIAGYVGPETFRKGVNAYLTSHAYGNATAQDFWSAIAATSGKPVDRIMPTFVNQPGAPLIEVAQGCGDQGTSVTLTARRFALDPAPTAESADERWDVPVCLKTMDRQTALCDVLTGARQTIPLHDKSCATWTFANAGAKGYYRTAYSPDLLRAMAPQVEDGLTAPERLSLVGDEWALVRARRHTIADYLALVDGFGRESSAPILSDIGVRLDFTGEYLTGEDTRAPFEAFVRRLFAPSLTRVGFSAAPNDTDSIRRLRAALIEILGNTGEDAGVVAKARAAVDAALAGGAPLDPTAADAIVGVAATHGDRALFDALLAASSRAATPEEHYRYLNALTKFRDPALIDLALQYTLSPELRSQDAPNFLGRLFRNPVARTRAWAFAKQHWPELQPKLAISGGDVTVVNATASFCDATARDDIKGFFAEHPLPAAARALDQAMERINNCISLRESQAPLLASYLAR